MGGAGTPKKLDVKATWREFDTDNSGVMSPAEVETLLQTVWRRYGVERPLSKSFIQAIMAELDANGDGRVMREEFMEIAEELWEEREQLFAQHGGGGSAPSNIAPRSPGSPVRPGETGAQDDEYDALEEGEWLHCPHCDFDIDPRDLDKYREELRPTKPPTMLGKTWERSKENATFMEQSASFHGHEVLPAGSVIRGNAPASYFQNAFGWWTPDNSILHF